MQKIKISDEVYILAGKDKGKTGKVKSLNLKTRKVIVEGVNLVKKTMKPTQENPNGGLRDVEAALHLSNVAHICPKTKKPTRIKIEKREGKNVRVSVKSGIVLE